eukprot:GHRR01028167.1.p1 GENE.GHRR01028167.1~~GHRR01028167.1.p1  ORF type:complete len:521 (+),score=214.38 GHRR01028167.1:384-1946(+)
MGSAVEAKNQIRASIKSLFPDRDCATLVRPMHDEQALVNLDQIPPNQLRPEFREGVAGLMQLIFAKAQPKHMGQYVLTGPVLSGLTEAYVKAINKGAVPTIATAWQGVAEQECRRAADLAQEAYTAAFNEEVAPEEAALDEEHQRCLQVAKEAYDAVAVGDDSVRRAHQQKYIEGCTARFAEVRARKLAEASALVNELLLKANTLVSSALNSASATPETMQQTLGQFLDQYVRVAAGPQKWVKLVDFLKTAYPQILRDITAKQEAQARADVSRLAEEVQAAHKQLNSLNSRAEQAEAQVSARSADVSDLQQQLMQQGQQLAAARVETQHQTGKAAALESQVQELQLVGEKRLMALQQETEAAARQARLLHQQEVISLESKLLAEQQRAAELTAQVTELESQLSAMSAKLSSQTSESSEYMRKYGKAKVEAAALATQLEEAKGQIAALQVQVQVAERGRDQALRAVADLEGQLEEIGEEIANHMQEAEAEREKSLTESRKGSTAVYRWSDVNEGDQLIKAV